MRKLLRPFLFLVCTLALLAAGCGKKAAAPKIEPGQYPGWIEVKLDPYIIRKPHNCLHLAF